MRTYKKPVVTVDAGMAERFKLFIQYVKIRNYRINSFRRELLEAVIAENVMNPKRLRRPGFYAPI